MTLADAVKEFFWENTGTVHKSVVASAIGVRYPGRWERTSHLDALLNAFANAGFLTRFGRGYFAKA
jgi:hypothetical protein